jgi:carnitine O-acetyltransferase
MSAIEDSIMALCFDHHTLNDGWASGSREEIKTHLENIRSGNGARNRWFDKTLSLIVESNSRAGLMGEHSPCDALLPSIVADYALVQAIDADSRLIPGPADVSRKSREWQRLDWKVDETIAQQCEEVATQADAIISDSDYNVFSFSHFGSDSLKRSKAVYVYTHSCSLR